LIRKLQTIEDYLASFESQVCDSSAYDNVFKPSFYSISKSDGWAKMGQNSLLDMEHVTTFLLNMVAFLLFTVTKCEDL
jgi:hypothetical protein